jgi:hypothetical protein
MGKILINSEYDQSWKAQYIQLMWKEKIIKKRKKLFTHFNEKVVRRDKIKCPTTKSCVEVILKDCQMPLFIKY